MRSITQEPEALWRLQITRAHSRHDGPESVNRPDNDSVVYEQRSVSMSAATVLSRTDMVGYVQ